MVVVLLGVLTGDYYNSIDDFEEFSLISLLSVVGLEEERLVDR